MQKFLRTLMLMALMIVPFASHAQVIVEIGESTSTTTQYTVPVNMYYNYSLTQQIFTADEIGVAGTINSIAFEYTNTSSFSMDSVRVYMKNVTKTEFATTTDMEAIASTDLVWEGTLSAADAGWVTLTLTTPFVYDGTSNLLVCCYDNQSGYPGSAFKFRTTTTGSAYRGIAYYSDSYTPSIDDVTTFSGTKTRYTYRNNIQLGITPSGNYCMKPTNLTVSNITASSATLTWHGEGVSYTLYEYANLDSAAYVYADTIANLVTLEPNTEYTFGVTSTCSNGVESSMTTVTFRTACDALATLPYTMGFEESEIAGTASADAFPFCWTRINTLASGTYTYYPYSSSSNSYAGSRKLYFYASSYGTYADTTGFVMPELDVVTYPMNTTRVTFWAKVTSTTPYTVLVGTMTDPTDRSTFSLVESVTVSGTDYTKYAVSMATASATAPYVAFLVPKVNATMYIDDVTLEEMPACLEISNLAAGNITSSSVELTWSDAANASATYTVYNMADTSVVATGVTGTTYTVTDLTANTQYTFGVAANCPAGDASIMTVSTRTACGEETMPWSENFDTWTTKSPCWSFLSGQYNGGDGTPTASTSAWTLNSTYGSYITISGKALTMNLYSTNKYWAVTPNIEITGDALLTLDVAATAWSAAAPNYDDNDTLAIAISTDGGTTFTTLQVLAQNELNALSGTFTTLYVPVSGYTGQTVRFAIYGGSTSGTSPYDNRMVIDNIAVSELTGSICYPVTGLAADNITADGATLTWTGDAASYNVYVIAADTTLVQNVATTTLTLTGLTAMTQYTYGVRSVCDSSESDMVTVTFATACAAVDVPYTETFESTSATRDCWNLVATGNIGGTYGMGFVTVNGRETLRFSSYSSASDYNQYGFSPVMNNTTTDSMHVKVVYATYNSSNSLYFGYIAGGDTVWNPTAYTTTGSSDWQTFEADLPANTTQLAVHYYGNYSYYAWIDSVEVTVAGGSTPVVADSVHITYAVNDATMGTTNPAPGTYTYVEGEAFSVTAVPATGYHLVDWQMALNIPDYGPYTEMLGTDTLTFGDTVYAMYEGMVLTAIFAADGGDTTVVECDPVTIPFVETFETTSATADCWTTDGPGIWTIATGDYSAATGAYEGSLNASITHGTSGDVTKFISPVLSGVTNGMQLQFAHIQRSWYGDIDNLAVYYRTSSDATWQQLAAYTDEVAVWTVETINIPGTVYQVAFEYTDHYGYGVGVDSIAFNLPPACMPVVNLTASNITATGATLSWTGSAASYNVYAIVDSVATLVQNVTVDSIDLTGLTAMTAYTYGVRAVCGTDESEMTTVTFATACGGETCNIEINGADSYGDGWNGNAIQVMQAGNVIATFTIASGNSASAQIPVCSGYPVSFAWVSGNYPSETSFEIKDGAGMVVYSESGSNLTGGEVFYTMNDACPSCIPAMVAIDTITETSVTISWTGTAASYDVYNGTTLVTNTTNNTYTFTGLTPATTYTFGVQAICSATDTAALATITVTTACADITTLPYMEGFENGLGCWSTVNGSADGMPWYAINSADYAHTGASLAASFSYYNYSPMHADAWLISPKFVLPTVNAGDTLNFSWWYRVDAGYPLDLYDVMLSTTTDDTTAFTTTLLAVIPDSNNGEYTQMVVDLTAYAGQSIYLAFHHHDSYNQDFLMIDDIFMGVGAAPVPEPDTLTVTFAVNDATMGTTVPAPGTYQYISGDTLSFSAMPNTGYIFNGWVIAYGDGSVDSLPVDYISASAPADLFMNYSPMTITALFGTVDPNSDSMQVNVAVNDPTMGTTIPAPGTHYFHVGEVASVVAVPNDGYHLTGWTVNVVSEGVTYVDTTYNYAIDDVFDLFGGWVVSESNAVFTWTVTANFAAGEPPVMHDSVTVNVSVNNETMGVVTPAPGTHYYVLGDTVIMSIMPNPGYRVVAVQMSATHPILGTLFDESITDSLELAELVGVNDTLIVDDEEMYGMVVNINVIFAAEGTEPTTYSVEVAYDQTKGTVTGAGDYVEGSNVRLVAMPATHYEFYAWLDNNTGDTVGRESVYAIANIDHDYFLTAIFVASTGIDDVDMDNVTIYSTDNVIVVRGAEGKQVTLFDVNGRMLSREARAAENVEFRVNNSGVYLVKVANAAAKRVVVIR